VILAATFTSTIITERVAAFWQQQWWRERAAMLRYTYVASLVNAKLK